MTIKALLVSSAEMENPLQEGGEMKIMRRSRKKRTKITRRLRMKRRKKKNAESGLPAWPGRLVPGGTSSIFSGDVYFVWWFRCCD